jgi:hypothetical protein
MHDTKERLSLLWLFALLTYFTAWPSPRRSTKAGDRLEGAADSSRFCIA